MTLPRPRVAILGGGPGGYEAALVAAQLGAEVTVIDEDGLGGACVLTDCVPSKTLIESSSTMTSLGRSASLGLQLADGANPVVEVDAPALNARIKALAAAQSNDIAEHVTAEGVRIIQARGQLTGPRTIEAGGETVHADVLLIATGASPRALPDGVPDGERILTCRQLYDLAELPEELIVVGSGVTGAEFASAYQALGSQVTLVSSQGAGAAARGQGRRRGDRGRLPAARHERARQVPRRGGAPQGRRRGRDARRRPAGDRLALPAHRGHGAVNPGDRPGRDRA